MNEDARQLFEAAIKLPEDQRSWLAAMLRDSLGDSSTQAEVDAATLVEVNRRLDNLDSGATQPVPYEVIKQKLRATVERARGRQASTG